jgi:hypothetical protein
MNELVTIFIHSSHIDSVQKIFFLLFLYQHPDAKGTCQELGARLYLGNTALVEKIIADLQQAGLIDQIGDGYKLHDEPKVRFCLGCLVETFADPLARQQLLELIKHRIVHPDLPHSSTFH